MCATIVGWLWGNVCKCETWWANGMTSGCLLSAASLCPLTTGKYRMWKYGWESEYLIFGVKSTFCKVMCKNASLTSACSSAHCRYVLITSCTGYHALAAGWAIASFHVAANSYGSSSQLLLRPAFTNMYEARLNASCLISSPLTVDGRGALCLMASHSLLLIVYLWFGEWLPCFFQTN